MTSIAAFAILITASALVVSMVKDVGGFIIPNEASLCILASFLLYALFFLPVNEVLVHFLIAALVFTGSFTLFCFKLFGAGDVKLLSALSLWAGPAMVLPLIFLMVVIGGFVSVYYMAKHVLCSKNKQAILKMKIPYGIAIGISGLILMNKHWVMLITQ